MNGLFVARRGSGAKRHSSTGINVGVAAATGTSNNAAAAIRRNAGLAAATGAANNATTSNGAVTYIGPVDTFTAGTYNGVWTTTGAGCSIVSGRSRQEITTGYIGEITTGFDYTFDEGQILAEVEIDATGDNRDVYLYVGKSGAAKAVVNVVGSTIYFVTDGTDSSIAYDATAHRWWRMTEASGDIIFATSPDGTTWTTRRTATAHGMDLTSVRVLLGAGRNTGTGGPFYAYFDNLNVPPVSAEPFAISQFETGTSNVSTLPPFFGAGGNDREPTAHAAALVLLGQASAIFNVHMFGFGTLSPWETIAERPDNATFDDDNWWSQDMYIVEVGDAASQTRMLTLALAPDWMKGGSDGNTTFTDPLFTENPEPGFVDEFAELCAIAVERFQPDMVQVWNEGKGMTSTSEYTTLFNAVYPAVKAAEPSTLVGGPYLVVHTFTAGQGGGNESSELVGDWGAADQRDLDAIVEFLEDCETDYLVVDGGNWRPDLGTSETHPIGAGRLCGFIADLMTWFRGLDDSGWASGNTNTMDVGWAEFYLWPKFWDDYYSSPSPEDETVAVMLRGWMTAVNAGYRYALHWEPEGDDDGQAEPLALFDSTRNDNTVGRGAATLFHPALKAIKDNFPPGTALYETGNTNVDVYTLANATHILSVNTGSGTESTVAIPGLGAQISHAAWEWKLTAWTPANVDSVLLLETGDGVLLETGDRLIMG